MRMVISAMFAFRRSLISTRRLRRIELQKTSDTEKAATKLDGKLILINFFLDMGREDFWRDDRHQEVFIVPLVRTSFLGDIEGLVLERASGESSIFQRIGFFSTSSWDDKVPILHRQHRVNNIIMKQLICKRIYSESIQSPLSKRGH